MVSVMQGSDFNGAQVAAVLCDLRDMSLSRARAYYADEVSAIVHRIVDDAELPSKPPVAAFSSLI
jgi:hypothetical protein